MNKEIKSLHVVSQSRGTKKDIGELSVKDALLFKRDKYKMKDKNGKDIYCMSFKWMQTPEVFGSYL